MKRIELLAPARNYDCAVEAIRHGADAVYIGAPRFGARAAAGNSLDDIARAADYAHLYGAKVYVALNTILFDDELAEAERLAHALYNRGVDALIIQDTAFLQLDLPPVALHASTQMNNTHADTLRAWQAAGIRRVVLARELSVSEIQELGKTVDVELEAFVHGALCVSYSGQCYASQACFKRSANRGECAQFCRLAFNLEDADGQALIRDRHLLSLKDMNRGRDLLALLDAGVTSLKIEGRLKDERYVKNVTAWYRARLDALFAKAHSLYERASYGLVAPQFEPDPAKSFHRGFTDYYLHGRTPDVASPLTPKSAGEPVGTVKEVRSNSFTVSGTTAFANGDGLTYFGADGKLTGFRVNRVENNRLFPRQISGDLHPRTPLFRNIDAAFERQLSRPSPERLLRVDIDFWETPDGFSLHLTDEEGICAEATATAAKEAAHAPQQRAYVAKQLQRLGGTPFTARSVQFSMAENWFVPASTLAGLRHVAMEKLIAARREAHRPKPVPAVRSTTKAFERQHLTYRTNVANEAAKAFYVAHGAASVADAIEKSGAQASVLMLCKYCLRFELGDCPKLGSARRALTMREPLYLALPEGKRFRLHFDCKTCLMTVYAPDQ